MEYKVIFATVIMVIVIDVGNKKICNVNARNRLRYFLLPNYYGRVLNEIVVDRCLFEMQIVQRTLVFLY